MGDHQKTIWIGVGVAGIVLSGCVGAMLLIYFSLLTKTFATDGVWLMGDYRYGRASYNTLEFGHEDRWYDGRPKMEIRLTRGETRILLRLHDMDVATLKRHGVTREVTWGAFSGSDLINIECADFYIAHGSFIHISIDSSLCNVWTIELRSDQSEEWIAMPIHEADAVKLFGEPRHTRVFFKP